MRPPLDEGPRQAYCTRCQALLRPAWQVGGVCAGCRKAGTCLDCGKRTTIQGVCCKSCQMRRQWAAGRAQAPGGRTAPVEEETKRDNRRYSAAAQALTWEHATWHLRLVAQRLHERAQRRGERTATPDQAATDRRDALVALTAAEDLCRLLGLDLARLTAPDTDARLDAQPPWPPLERQPGA